MEMVPFENKKSILTPMDYVKFLGYAMVGLVVVVGYLAYLKLVDLFCSASLIIELIQLLMGWRY